MTARKLTPSELSLLDVIKASIASEPYEFDGRLWCQKSHRERAQAIGANSTKTVERALKKSPFVTDTTIIKGVGKVVLARIAQPGEKPTPRTYAKQMRTVWRGWLAICIRLAEAGCDPYQIMAITGHQSLAEVQTYIAGVNKLKLAQEAIDSLPKMTA